MPTAMAFFFCTRPTYQKQQEPTTRRLRPLSMPGAGLCEAESRGQGPRRGAAPCCAVRLVGVPYITPRRTHLPTLQRGLSNSQAVLWRCMGVGMRSCVPCIRSPAPLLPVAAPLLLCGGRHAGVAHVVTCPRLAPPALSARPPHHPMPLLSALPHPVALPCLPS